MYDDAVPERFLSAAAQSDEKKLLIHHGTGNPSPYIVKLSRGTDAPSTAGTADAIQALAASLIIDGDDDSGTIEMEHEDLGIDFADISSQLRERDVAYGVRMIPQEKSSASIEFPRRPVSLDDALAAYVDPAISLEAFVPITSVMEEVPLEQIAQEQRTPNTVAPDSSLRRVMRFEWGFFHHLPTRALGAFVLLSFIVVLPLHAMQVFSGTAHQVNAVKDVGFAALDDVSRATDALAAKDFSAAGDDFSAAAEKFAFAQESLGGLHAGVVALVNSIPQTDRTYESVRGLVTAGQELSQTASIMSEAMQGIPSQSSTDVVTKLNLLGAYIENALPHALAAEAALAKVRTSVVPAEYTATIARLQADAPMVAASMQEFVRFIHTLTFVLGGNSTMRYLALFQNNTELRPTGGFVGSFAEISMNNGAIAAMRLPGGGTYDTQGQLDTFVAAPRPLQLINPRWEFQDGNWFPDFPTSAKKMQWFYEHAGGPTTDGVVAVNATFVEKLLEVIGPIEMPEYGVTLNAENFVFTTEKAVEIDADKTKNTPKAFLGDLVPRVIEKIKGADAPTFMKILLLIERGLAEKDIQLSFRDNDAQKLIADLGFDGAVRQTDGDYLMVVNTNVGGGKTDAVIDQQVDVVVDIAETGTIDHALTLTKTHRGMANAVFTGKNNVDYVRFYVPEGSVLLSADGFEPPPESLFESSSVPLGVDDDLSVVMSEESRDALLGIDTWNEFGKTVFGGWMQTAPGETQVVQLSYRIPQVLFRDEGSTSVFARARNALGLGTHDGYSLFVQKQSGVVSRDTTVRVSVPSTMHTAWTNVTGADTNIVTFQNTHDVFSGWLLKK